MKSNSVYGAIAWKEISDQAIRRSPRQFPCHPPLRSRINTVQISGNLVSPLKSRSLMLKGLRSNSREACINGVHSACHFESDRGLTEGYVNAVASSWQRARKESVLEIVGCACRPSLKVHCIQWLYNVMEYITHSDSENLLVLNPSSFSSFKSCMRFLTAILWIQLFQIQKVNCWRRNTHKTTHNEGTRVAIETTLHILHLKGNLRHAQCNVEWPQETQDFSFAIVTQESSTWKRAVGIWISIAAWKTAELQPLDCSPSDRYEKLVA